jgi:O-antigen/teichoic acid export membrane protein
LTTGTAIAQIIPIVTAPLLYRLYEKECYGALGLYMAFASVVGVFSTLQYLQTVLLEKDDASAINALWLNRVVNSSIAILTLILLSIFYSLITECVDNPILNKWIWLLPISIFFGGQNEIFRIWANRKKEYNLLTYNSIFIAVFTPIITITLGLVIKNEVGLFTGLIAGQVLPSLILFLGLRKKYNLGPSEVSLLKMKQIASENKNFPLYSLPTEFINQVTNQLPIFMLNSFLGPAAVGVYNLAMRMLGLPIQFIGNSIGAVFQQRATEDYHNTGSCRIIFLKSMKMLGAIAVVPTLVMILFGPDLFAWFFGLKWRDAGEYARILAIMFCAKLIASPLSYVFLIAKKQVEDFVWHTYMIVSNLLIFYTMLKYKFSVDVVLFVFSINQTFIYAIYLFRSYGFSKVDKF